MCTTKKSILPRFAMQLNLLIKNYYYCISFSSLFDYLIENDVDQRIDIADIDGVIIGDIGTAAIVLSFVLAENDADQDVEVGNINQAVQVDIAQQWCTVFFGQCQSQPGVAFLPG